MLEPLGHVFANGVCVTTAASLQEYRFIVARQGTDNWPMDHIVFRNKSNGCERIHRKDIDPADVVGRDEANLSRQASFDLEREAKMAE